jgi:hypothetical protein
MIAAVRNIRLAMLFVYATERHVSQTKNAITMQASTMSAKPTPIVTVNAAQNMITSVMKGKSKQFASTDRLTATLYKVWGHPNKKRGATSTNVFRPLGIALTQAGSQFI